MNEEVHKCSKSVDINRIHEKITALQKVVYGNGKKGLVSTVDIMGMEVSQIKETLDTVRMDLNAVKSNVEVLVRFQVQTETKDEVLSGVAKREGVNRRWLIGLAISVLFTLLSSVVLIVVFIMDIKNSTG